jgi:hypothetical protein
MTIVIILLGILIIFFLINRTFVKEPFEDISLDENVIQGYNNFLSFYNSFCPNWQKAIVSSIAADIPQQPLTSPSQISTTAAPQISESEQNAYIQKLEKTLNKALPPICTSLPSNIDSSSLKKVLQQIPVEPASYLNALNWMNEQLEKAHSNLGNALQGKVAEGFEDMCQNISKCIADNPELAKEIEKQLSEQNQQNIIQDEQELMNKINPFISMPELAKALSNNVDLVQKSQDIQNKAQSGEILNQMNIPGSDSQITYTIPPGGNALSQMKENDPQKYDDYKQNYSQWFMVKSLIEQINSNLR